MSIHIEGTLYKWTNYYSGWQPRWFILEEGILSYYLAASEVLQGCRGSVKIGSCEIVAHHKDENRIDIIIPKGRHIYVRACTRAERQKWLVALGSAKQEMLLDSPKPLVSHEEMVRSQMEDLHLNCQLLVTHIASIKNVLADSPGLDGKRLEELSLLLSTTCDTFLNTLAECMDLSYNDTEPWPSHLKPLPSSKSFGSPMIPSVRSMKIHRAGSPGQPNLGVTRTASGFSAQELYTPSSPSSSSLPSSPWNTIPNSSFELSLPSHLKTRGHSDAVTRKKVETSSQRPRDGIERSPTHMRTHTQTSRSQERNHVYEKNVSLVNSEEAGHSPSLPDSSYQDTPSTSSFPSPSPSPQSSHDGRELRTEFRSPAQLPSDLFITPTSSPYPSPPPSPLPPSTTTYETFFSKTPHKFKDIRLSGEDGIPTVEFLQCCKDVLPFFDALGSTAFAPVKSDINGNIEKLSCKHQERPHLYLTLQAMVLHELETNTHANANSATDALLWLKRAMEFVQHFLEEVSNGEQSLDVAAGKAYGKSLRRYHNWFVRGIFNLAVKAVPYHDNFLVMLGSDGSPQASRVVVHEMRTFARSLGAITSVLNQFYHKHKLDLPEQM